MSKHYTKSPKGNYIPKDLVFSILIAKLVFGSLRQTLHKILTSNYFKPN